jgi:hypothetical protein
LEDRRPLANNQSLFGGTGRCVRVAVMAPMHRELLDKARRL